MNPLEPGFESATGHSALRVWMDFWELTGRLRVDIIRTSESGGDPAKLIPPDITTTEVKAVPSINMDRETDVFRNRAGEIPLEILTMEFIDCVRNTDRLRVIDIIHEVDSVIKRDMGNFSIWIVRAHRIDSE